VRNNTKWLGPKVSGKTKDGGESRERLEPCCGNLGLFWLRVITRYIPLKNALRGARRLCMGLRS
jgi:hypothetical protein